MGVLLGGALLLLAACGGGGGGGTGGNVGGSSSGGGIGDLSLLSYSPGAEAVQVDVDATLEFTFDGVIDEDALNEEEFSLTKDGGSPIPGSFSLSNGGKTVRFQPSSPMDKATDYVFTLAPTICDQSFRTLDKTVTIPFRTFDDIPPKVASSSVAQNATGVSRTGTIRVSFDEILGASTLTTDTVTLKDNWGTSIPIDILQDKKDVLVTPIPDLAGSKLFTLKFRGGQGGVKDRAGNPLESSWVLRFTSAVDNSSPSLLSSDPENNAVNVSPAARLSFTFDESMDPGSYEPTGLTLTDSGLNPVSFTLGANASQRSIHLYPTEPLQPGETYTVTFSAGVNGLTDVSGNNLSQDLSRSFTVGSDSTAPSVTSSIPSAQADKVSPNVVIEVWFNEPLKSSTVNSNTISLLEGGVKQSFSAALDATRAKLTVTPSSLLDQNSDYILRLKGGFDGIQDEAGNPLGGDVDISFRTSSSAVLPSFIVSPDDGAVGVPVTSKITILANEAVDPATVDNSRITLKNHLGQSISGSLSVSRGKRAIIFTPSSNLPSGGNLTLRIQGGSQGLRLASGNWLTKDATYQYRVGYTGDTNPPDLTLTLNGIESNRNKGLVVPTSGFTLDITAWDSYDAALDWTSLDLKLSGPASVPSSDELFVLGSFTGGTCSIRLPSEDALDPGSYTIEATIKDTSGNESSKASLQFSVISPSTEVRPFERTQIVWVQFDLDREGKGKGDGTADFDQDLFDYGLMTKGDPIGRNAFMRKVVMDGVLAATNKAYLRAADSSSKGVDSVHIRLVTRKPCRAPHMKMSVGGKDPDGKEKRGYGDESTGILGRALYDYQNSTPNENNSGTSPGLGVFPGELFLYQAKQYIDLYPYFITTFGRTFKGLSPHMGGTPAGKDSRDKKVLADDFDYSKASPSEKARYDEIMNAADDFATVVGVILAHEIGHSLGLVAEGTPSKGLHGDSSLHNMSAGLKDIMSAVISYESLVSYEFKFRALNRSYLQERTLVK